jgi:ketosteroid isomerase-like protein
VQIERGWTIESKYRYAFYVLRAVERDSVRFQMSEVVDSSDPELVLRVLETCLLAQWTDVTREGNMVVLRGLGASHRVVNRNDRAVFTTQANDGDKTTIAADVTYQASALVGTAAPQNEMVQRKLDSVLEMVRMDLDLAQRRRAQAAERAAGRTMEVTASQPMPVSYRPEPLPEKTVEAEKMIIAPDVAPVAAPVIAEALTPTLERVHEPIETPEVPSEKVEAAAVVQEPTHELPSEAKAKEQKIEPAVTRDEFSNVTANLAEIPIAFLDPAAVAAERPLDADEIRLVHREEIDDKDDDEEPSSGGKRFFVALLMLAIVAGLGWAGWRDRTQIKQTHAWMASRAWVMHLVGQPAEPAPVSSSDTAVATGGVASSAPVANPTPPAAAAPAADSGSAAATSSSATSGISTPPDTATTEKAAEDAKLAEPDPAKWLENWADVMRGSDAALLASYYADPVDRYYLQPHLSRAQVMADKQASMDKRLEPWTVQLENVQVLDRTDTTARVLLVKHFSIGTGTPAAKQLRWPTQLRLKMVDGRWQTLGE